MTEANRLDMLAWALYKDRRYAQAAICEAEALRQMPSEPRFLYHAGLIAYALGNKEEARELVLRSLLERGETDDREECLRTAC